VRAGARVTEVPITFAERALGRSKMSSSIVAEALVRVTAWGIRDRLADWLPGRVRRPVPERSREGGRSSAAR
jgi:dolichol-phosphate mannosyltransferase